MSESFSVGEIAVFHGLTEDLAYNGTECEIIGPLKIWPTRTRGPWFGYRTRSLVDGSLGPCRPEKLRKRRPPQDWKSLCNLTDAPKELAHV